jgi:hypothetical protein
MTSCAIRESAAAEKRVGRSSGAPPGWLRPSSVDDAFVAELDGVRY